MTYLPKIIKIPCNHHPVCHRVPSPWYYLVIKLWHTYLILRFNLLEETKFKKCMKCVTINNVTERKFDHVTRKQLPITLIFFLISFQPANRIETRKSWHMATIALLFIIFCHKKKILVPVPCTWDKGSEFGTDRQTGGQLNPITGSKFYPLVRHE